MSMLAFDEDSSLIQAVDFDWDQVERNLAQDKKAIRRHQQRDYDTALVLCAVLCRWIIKNGKRDPAELRKRAIIVCWHMLPEMRHMGLTQLSNQFGVSKQAFGKWVDDFKRTFPRWRIGSTKYSTARRMEAERKEAMLSTKHHVEEMRSSMTKLSGAQKRRVLETIKQAMSESYHDAP